MKTGLAPLATVLSLGLATSASAQEKSWEYTASIYLFGAETVAGFDNGVRSGEGTLSFSDALENLDFAFMGSFAAHNGQWGGFVDFLYYDLTFNSPVAETNVSLRTKVEMQALTLAGLYRVHETATSEVDLLGGLRWFDVESSFEFSGGPGLLGPFDSAQDWVDPIVGVRANFDLADRWSATALADYGGFSSDSETWQLLFTADYALSDNWSLRGGYRHIEFDHTDDGTNLKIRQSGPVFGASYRF